MEKNVQFFASIYRFLLLLPISKFTGISFSRSRSLTFLTFLFLLYYWIALIISLASNQKVKMNLITKTSNVIQFLVNSIALTVVLLNPCVRLSRFQEILTHIHTLEGRFLAIGVHFKDAKNRRNALIFFMIPILFFLYVIIFDAILTFTIQKILGTLYWVTSILPNYFILLTSIQVCLFLFLIRMILTKCTEILAQELHASPAKVFVRSEERKQPSFIPGIFHILTDIIDLSELVNGYFGPIFLVIFATIFVTSSIQFYYVYIVLTADPKTTPWDNLRIFSFVASINMILPNMIFAMAVTWLCQDIRNVSKKNVVLIQKLQNRGSTDFLPIELQKIVASLPYCINEITFSAVDFFKVDLNMLVGMFGTILTYLVIYIQFSNIYGITYSDGHVVRDLVQDSSVNEDQSGGNRMGTMGLQYTYELGG